MLFVIGFPMALGEQISDDFSVFIAKTNELIYTKKIFDDNISTKFYINNQNPSNILEISDSSDAKSGINSMRINVDVVDEFAAITHDFSKKGLQDWSNYNYIGFWFKGEKSFDTIQFSLRDADWQRTGKYDFVDDSDQWKKVIIPLKSTFFPLLDISKVGGIEFIFKKIQINQAQIANFQILSNKYTMQSIDNYDFIQGESLIVFGEVKIRDGESPITIEVRDPTGNVSSVNKVVPSSSNSFNLTIPISGKQFNKDGLYSINTLYGNNVYSLPINFKVVNPQFLLNYDDFDIHKVGEIVYAIPNTEEFNLDRLRNDEYDILNLRTSNTIPTLTAPTVNDIKIKIDEITKPLKKLLEPIKSFPISNKILHSIWNDRVDLQEKYPEVNQGNFKMMTEWAKQIGWSEEPILSELIPAGEIPDYLKKTDPLSEPLNTKEIIPIFGIIISIVIGGFIAYRYILKNKQKV